ncbi:MAG: diacylglycerol kinase family lipid kinase [Lachnospiraceae bacterium]|nr:diacylglycerol kinase family lipid kinase [Lachnospiraceae bacterium]
MKGLFIVNPSSGRQNFKDSLNQIAGKLIMDKIVPTIDVFYTKKKNDARNRVALLSEGEYDFVVAVGGDGTLNEVVNGLILSESNTPLAIISSGTVNDFATYLKLPGASDVDAFCQMIKDFKLKEVDAGQINDEYFINVIAGGILTDIAYKVPKDRKAIFGKLAYYVEGAIELPKQFFGDLMKLEFEVDGETRQEEVTVFIIANSRSVGGFKDAVPMASITDGKLDILILKKVELFQVSNLLFKFLQGEHPQHPCIEYLQANEIKIREVGEKTDISIDYDGELLEGGMPIDVKVIPKALKIIVPDYDKEK